MFNDRFTDREPEARPFDWPLLIQPFSLIKLIENFHQIDLVYTSPVVLDLDDDPFAGSAGLYDDRTL